MNDEEYPPLFQLDIVRNVGLCFAVQFQSHVEVAPRQRCQHASYHEQFAQVRLTFPNAHAQARRRHAPSSSSIPEKGHQQVQFP